MCTLSYLLTDNGYELFFNRDEQRSRQIALTPEINKENQAIYPIDPQGKGTWLAVNQQGLSLALLNYYQACDNSKTQSYVSRGQLIPTLMLQLKNTKNKSISDLLQAIDLSIYQPFQLATFPNNLSKTSEKVSFYQWDGSKLVLTNKEQPFTSSGVDFDYVEKQRKDKFKQLICPKNATREQFKNFHSSQETAGKYSVNMERFDAKTVSISHICVEHRQQKTQINFDYYDNIYHQLHQQSLIKKV